LRFFAALAVFIYHSKIFYDFFGPYQLGKIGVSFFFILSGFIMTTVYKNIFTSINYNKLSNFYISRFAKIYPLHILCFALTIPAMLSAYGVNIQHFFDTNLASYAVINILLLQSWFPNNNDIFYAFNNVSWTLSVEAVFYALFPFLLISLDKIFKIVNRKYIYILAIMSVIIFMICINYNYSMTDNTAPLVRLPEFILGIIASLFVNKFNKTDSFKKYRLESISVILLLLSIASFPYVNDGHLAIGTLTALPILILIIVFSMEKGEISRLLGNKYFIWLGEISFAFYMTHLIVINTLHAANSTLGTVMSLFITIFISSLLYKYFEEPLRISIKSIFNYVKNRE
jgi:peptidoglycan/LPS O-acetylase OafA/YrhL